MRAGPDGRASAFDQAAFVLLCALVVWAPLPLGSNRPWAWSLLEAGLFLAGLAWLAGWVRREAAIPPAARAAWPAFALLGLWLAYLLLQWLPLPPALVRTLSPAAAALHDSVAYLGPPGRWITISVDPHATRAAWLLSCAYAVAFALALLLVRDLRRLGWLCAAIVAAGALQAFAGALLHLGRVDLDVLGMPIPHSQRASGTYVNRNHLAGLLEMTLAVGIGLMVGQLEDRPRRGWRQFVRETAELLLSTKAMLRLVLVIMVIGLVMTRSRVGNAAFFASLMVAGGIALVFSRRAPRSTVVFIASLVVVDVLLVGAWFGVEQTAQRLSETTVAGVGARQNASAEALRIVADHPLTGTGAGTFYAAFPRYRGPDLDVFYDHAHNDYVQFLAETGIVGTALAGLFAAFSVGCALLALLRRTQALPRGVAFGVVMGATAIGIHSAVDFNLQIPANALVFVLLMALGWLSLHLDRSGHGKAPSGADHARASHSRRRT